MFHTHNQVWSVLAQKLLRQRPRPNFVNLPPARVSKRNSGLSRDQASCVKGCNSVSVNVNVGRWLVSSYTLSLLPSSSFWSNRRPASNQTEYIYMICVTAFGTAWLTPPRKSHDRPSDGGMYTARFTHHIWACLCMPPALRLICGTPYPCENVQWPSRSIKEGARKHGLDNSVVT